MKKKRKAYSMDTMMRFFLQYYNIPTKKDIDKILDRIDRLERVVRNMERDALAGESKGRSSRKAKTGKARGKMTATDKILAILRDAPRGIDVAGLKTISGYEDKKVRNIVFRLQKKGAIQRIGRGIYRIGR
jgi:hypothetical protein